jgi:parallel beta helix pectate lyase-like protein
MGSRAIVWAAGLAVALVLAAPTAAAGRDDTARLQAALDAGGSVFLPKLPNGECYATRGLWLSRDDTTVTSDGACIVALGPGEARIETGDGRPVRANAVFFLNHSNIRVPPPVRVSISGLDIRVPASARMLGVAVFGHETTLSDLRISGAPTTGVLVGSGRLGAGGMTGRVEIRNSMIVGAQRDQISVFGPVGLRVEGNTLSRGRGNGLRITAADRGQPAVDVHVTGNTVVDNGGAGILLDLDPKNGLPVLASGLEVSRNTVLRNARAAPVTRRAGIVLAGGQRDRAGSLTLTGNVVHANRGPGILGRHLALAVAARDNDLRSNRAGATRGLRVTASGAAPAQSAQPFVDSASGPSRDDTAALQARLDRGSRSIFLPKLPNGGCYATRGLWVSRDGTTITSDGACVLSLGQGEVRLHSTDGDPIPAGAVFFVNRSRPTQPAPVGVTISGLRIVVPAGQTMYGVSVAGHDVTLSHLDVGGSPKDDVIVGARGNGNAFAADVSVLDSTLEGAMRNAISATGVVGLRIEGNTIQDVRDSPPGQPAAGIDVEPDDRGQPTLGVHILRNTIQDNAGPGILFELETNNGNAVVADDFEISGNRILRNSQKRTPPKRAGVVLAGGQDVDEGSLVLSDNVVRDNGGPGILGSRLRLVVQLSGNDLGGNEDGPSRGLP